MQYFSCWPKIRTVPKVDGPYFWSFYFYLINLALTKLNFPAKLICKLRRSKCPQLESSRKTLKWHTTADPAYVNPPLLFTLPLPPPPAHRYFWPVQIAAHILPAYSLRYRPKRPRQTLSFWACLSCMCQLNTTTSLPANQKWQIQNTCTTLDFKTFEEENGARSACFVITSFVDLKLQSLMPFFQ